jgi:hypothetical protein
VTEPEGQPPSVILYLLEADPPHGDGTDCHEPLTAEQVAALLDEAQKAASDFVCHVSRIGIRLALGIEGITIPYPAEGPVADRKAALDRLFTDRYPEGAAPDLVAQLCRLMNGTAGTGQAGVTAREVRAPVSLILLQEAQAAPDAEGGGGA